MSDEPYVPEPGDIVTLGKSTNTWRVSHIEGEDVHIRAVLTRVQRVTRADRMHLVRRGS